MGKTAVVSLFVVVTRPIASVRGTVVSRLGVRLGAVGRIADAVAVAIEQDYE